MWVPQAALQFFVQLIVAADALARRIEPLASTVLVPVFFAYSAFATHLALLWSIELLGIAVLVIAIASVGKAAGCWAAARLAGRSNPESMTLVTTMAAGPLSGWAWRRPAEVPDAVSIAAR